MSRHRLETLEFETIASLLASETRRTVLARLRTVDRTTAHDLSRYLTAADRETDLDDAAGTRTAAIALHHNHLPRLAEHGVVDYDESEAEVTPGPNFDDLEPIIDCLERVDD
ncbi:hypothetical protein [Natrinema sp. 74]|uniref:DUF7344 domain-containing protein n=1 Tax=Natrinema sp. 74 TaxID=3384159 RepID=UPI0038D4C54F